MNNNVSTCRAVLICLIGALLVEAETKYEVLPIEAGWDNALKLCQAVMGSNAKLALIDPTNLQEVSKNLTAGFNWIDLRFNNGLWVMSNGSEPQSKYWDPGYPDLAFGECAGFRKVSGTWCNIYCSSEVGVVCATDGGGGGCPPDYQPVGSSCYRFVLDQPAGQTEAEAACNKDGGSLVSVHDDQQRSALEAAVADAVDQDQKVWTGLKHSSTTQKYSWTDGSETDYIKHADINKPAVPSKDCALISGDEGKGWVWDKCTEEAGFVCQVQPTQ